MGAECAPGDIGGDIFPHIRTFTLPDGKEIDMVVGGTTLSTGVIEGKQTVFCHYGA